MSQVKRLFWFRRDLRLADNHGLYQALKQGDGVQAIFIFDKNILEKLDNKEDRRVSLIHSFLQDISSQLSEIGASLKVYHGYPSSLFKEEIIRDFPNIEGVYCNEDYEPYALERDAAVADFCKTKGISFKAFKDQVIFHKNEVLKADLSPYTVFTPYANKWKAALEDNPVLNYPSETLLKNFVSSNYNLPSIEDIGFVPTSFQVPKKKVEQSLLDNYAELRDRPDKKGTSKMSPHLRFGSVSVRQLALQAINNSAAVYLNELIWRDFYHMILWHFPHVVKGPFKKKYENIPWRNNEQEFELWCEGKTGIPIVDAGMRELLQTGLMHNRVRMIVASFLTKNLLIDWRWGEAFFAEHLLDFDLAANNGGWQWAASSGCDAAPYFRIFNPESQAKKFDPKGEYIRKWVPEFESLNYPAPMVDLKNSRKRAIEVFKTALS